MNNKTESKDTHTVPFLIDYQVPVDVGALILIDILYEQGKINKATYDKIQRKYGKLKNKESEVSNHEK